MKHWNGDDFKNDLGVFFRRTVDWLITRKKLIAGVFFATLFVFLLYLWKINYLTTDNILALLKAHPVLAPFLYIVFYILMVIAFISTLPLNLAAGFLWGPVWGGLISIVGAASGGIIAFAVARYLAFDYFNQKFSSKTWLILKDEIKRNNWKVVAFTRINPVFPFGLLSYFFGLTPVSFYQYIWATFVFMSPMAILMAFLGNAIGGWVVEGQLRSLFTDAFIVLFVLTLLILGIFIFKRYSHIKDIDL